MSGLDLEKFEIHISLDGECCFICKGQWPCHEALLVSEVRRLRHSHARLLQVAKIASEGGTPHPGYQAFARAAVAEAEALCI
jgi:hypothetical protein